MVVLEDQVEVVERLLPLLQVTLLEHLVGTVDIPVPPRLIATVHLELLE
jgi:hypothetical protein